MENDLSEHTVEGFQTLERNLDKLKASCDEKPLLKSIDALILFGCIWIEPGAGWADTAGALRNKHD